jgi:squalene-hopene/tetraprenyl-beta-curcumene cyclase
MGTWLAAKSDAYATGLIALALQETGTPRENPSLERALSWLRRNQDPAEGRWPPFALNKTPNPNSIIGHFRSDAGTAFAVLALARDTSAEKPATSTQLEIPKP